MGEEKKKSKRPAMKVRTGSLVITTWENKKKNKEGNEFTILSHQVEKNYKDGEEWKTTNSVNTDELLPLAEALRRTWKKARMKEEEGEEEWKEQ